jgi:two-component system, NarL family, response regulator NreC
MTTIVLADDHRVLRKGLREFLNTESDFDIVGETGDGLETVNLVTKLRPDILVLDLIMPGINGLEVIRQLNQKKSQTAVIVLSLQGEETCIKTALRYGARAYVLKEDSLEELIKAIREVTAGRPYLNRFSAETCLSLN